MAKIRVLIADDHPVLRAGLKALAESSGDIEVVAEAETVPQAMQKTRETQPDVATLDINMPGGSGLQLVERIRRELPAVRVLVLTMHDDVSYLRAALAAGAAGYLVKNAADNELLAAIRSVHAGEGYIDPRLAGKWMQGAADTRLARPSHARPGPSRQLSDREREVLELLAHGHTHQEVADRLFLSVKTIETYRSRLAQKLGLRSRADLIRYALEVGILAHPSDPQHP
jgi:two-component system response regulator NreC